MYVCTNVRMYVCTNVRMYVCTYVRMYVCMYVCTDGRTYVRMYVCKFDFYLYFYIYRYMCVCVCGTAFAYTEMYIYIYTLVFNGRCWYDVGIDPERSKVLNTQRCVGSEVFGLEDFLCRTSMRIYQSSERRLSFTCFQSIWWPAQVAQNHSLSVTSTSGEKNQRWSASGDLPPPERGCLYAIVFAVRHDLAKAAELG